MKETPEPKFTNGQLPQGDRPQNGNQPNAAITTLDPKQSPSPQPSQGMTKSGDSDNKVIRAEAFDQPVILKQTPIWSRAIVWGIVGVVTFGIAWACLAKIEEAVPATGILEPQGAVWEIEPPIAGKVEEVLVEDGDEVRKGDLLVRLDPTAAQAERESLAQVRDSLVKENQFYRAQLGGVSLPSLTELAEIELPPEVLALTTSRRTLLEENALYASLLTGQGGGNFSPNQQIRLGTLQTEANSRIAAAQLEVERTQRELIQTRQQIATIQEASDIEQSILENIEPLVAEGAIAELQYNRQQVEVLNRRAELDRLTQQEQVLGAQLAQAQEQLVNTVALSRNDIMNRMADNEKRIAEIDSELNKRIVENDKQLADLNSQLSQTELTLNYQEIRSPIDGIVFDLQAQDQGFINNNSPEPILKVVPGDALVAKVFITNQDIGFVEPGMDVDVRIDSFPFSEFGDVEGELKWIGSDALPPDEIRPFYHFPARIEIDQQYINVSGRPINLQSGMSISVNIKTRKKRVISIFTDNFVRKVESLRQTR
ncbi:MAG: HlyD family efflux transporter periplasmic adaptor subunit [Synechococcales bacterium]|nr:HlyD family efflux transporter periplasmic adaptor subunit [Synechococcales bacterium]